MRLSTPPAVAVFLLLLGCGPPQKEPVAHNLGALIFHLSDSVDVRIPGEFIPNGLVLENGTERLVLNSNDGCYTVPVFDGTICLDSVGNGFWTDILLTGPEPYQVPLGWEPQRGSPSSPGKFEREERWRLTFGTEDPWFGDLIMQIDPDGALVGTIETATGDFRFLHGKEQENRITLQTFDGAHLFHFAANRGPGNQLTDGHFHSGNHYHTTFTGALAASDTPALGEGMRAQWTGAAVAYEGVDLFGGSKTWNWSPTDTSIHVISVMGSWCPNCMDEHRLLLELATAHPGIILHTLPFERGIDKENGEKTALARLKAYRESMEMWRHEDRWSITLVGPASKKEAQAALPFLDRVVSFPTTIVLRPQAEEPWIHSGFNGPATGAKYELERQGFTQAIIGSKESH